MTRTRIEAIDERIAIQREAIAALKEAEEAFDQACAVLKDAGMYRDSVQLANSGFRFDAEDLNMKLIPALINKLERDLSYREDD